MVFSSPESSWKVQHRNFTDRDGMASLTSHLVSALPEVPRAAVFFFSKGESLEEKYRRSLEVPFFWEILFKLKT